MPRSYGGQPSLDFAVSIGIRVPGRDGSRQVSSTQSQHTHYMAIARTLYNMFALVRVVRVVFHNSAGAGLCRVT